mmetsp:Transcript_40572/g.85157  ORF Transcript_40572/g.85157 Transcript_40572/m.85157 type:complete len:125 (-) Transcript_40572:299-673(-)
MAYMAEPTTPRNIQSIILHRGPLPAVLQVLVSTSYMYPMATDPNISPIEYDETTHGRNTRGAPMSRMYGARDGMTIENEAQARKMLTKNGIIHDSLLFSLSSSPSSSLSSFDVRFEEEQVSDVA